MMIITLRTLCGCERTLEVERWQGDTFYLMLVTPRRAADFMRVNELPSTPDPVARRVFRRDEFLCRGRAYPVYVEVWDHPTHVETMRVTEDIVTEIDYLRSQNKALCIENAELRKARDDILGAFLDIAKGKT